MAGWLKILSRVQAASLIASVSGVASCASVAPPAPEIPSGAVAGRYWGLRQVGADQVRRASPETATLLLRPDGHVEGTASCNSVGGAGIRWTGGDAEGRFEHDRDQPMIQTVVGCPDERQTALAGRFWQRMEGATRWSVRAGRLKVEFGDGSSAVLTPVAVPAFRRRETCSEGSRNFDCSPNGRVRP